MAINRSHKKRDLDAHVVESAGVVEKGATNAPVDDIAWDVRKGEVHSSTTFQDDEGEGQEVILRRFEYQLPPKLAQPPSKKELLTFHEQRIKAVLWADNLDLIQDMKLVFGKKGKFDIFATCTPKKGHLIWNHKATTLKDIANDHAQRHPDQLH